MQVNRKEIDGPVNERRIGVFHLIKSLGRGGAEVLLAESLRYSDREQFRYTFGYFLPWKNAMVASVEQQGADVLCFDAGGSAGMLLRARRIARTIQSLNVDVLHCHLPMAGIVGRLAGKLAGVPVVYSEHNKQERYHPVTRSLNAATWRWQSRVVAVSSDVATSIRAHIDSPVPVDVVLNGVDVERFQRGRVDPTAVREAFGIPRDAPVIGTVAVFRTQKRLEDWVSAARLIRDRHPDAHFLLVGDGPLRHEVHTAVSANGLADAVHLPGLQEDVRPYLAAMNIYMMSSIFEGLPVALLEAMAMQCGVVCTAVGGIPEVVRSGDNGLLVEAGQPPALATAASDLLNDPERLAHLGINARRTVITDFGMQRMTQALEHIYTDVVERHRS